MEVTLKYEDGITLKVAQEKFKGLTALSLVWNGETITVPDAEFAEIRDPDLGNIQFYVTSDAEGKKLACVEFQYDHRPYPWGDASSKVRFKFTEGKFSSRERVVPTGENTWRTSR